MPGSASCRRGTPLEADHQCDCHAARFDIRKRLSRHRSDPRGSVGPYSVLAMAAVCAVAYAVGSVIRFNIKHAEPVLADQPGEATLALERSSDLALVIAYVVSVCLYLPILSAFVLGGLNVDTGINEDLLTSAVIILITLIGIVKGLDVLDSLEEWALYVTLAIIAVLIFGFGVRDWTAWQSPSGLTMIKALHHTPWEILTIVARPSVAPPAYTFDPCTLNGKLLDSTTRSKDLIMRIEICDRLGSQL